MPRIRMPLLVLVVTAFIATTLIQPPPGSADALGGSDQYERLRREAEQAYAEGSYAIALRLYQQADGLQLDPESARWVDFRLADCRWRSQASTRQRDPSDLDAARRELEMLVAAIERTPDRDRVWAEAHASLGDFWWDRSDSQNWGPAWPHYQQALDWWAGSSDLELARDKYVGMVRTMVEPAGWSNRSWFPAYVPVELLDNALEIAEPADRPFLHYVLARTIQQQGGDWSRRSRVVSHYEAAIEAGREVDWYDDALFGFGQWLMQQGRVVKQGQGRWTAEPDFVAAVEVFRRLLEEFRPGQSQYVDNARSMIEQMTAPSLSVGVSNIFLPGSEIEYHLGWRNVPRIDLTLYPTMLARDAAVGSRDRNLGDWARLIDVTGLRPLRQWTLETGDEGKHRPGAKSLRLDEPLEAGAYVLVASAGGQTARELVLVTDATIVVKADERKLVAFCADAISGAPLANAQVRVWSGRWRNGRLDVRDQTQPTGEDGIAVFEHDRGGEPTNATHLVAAALGDRQAISRLDTWPVGSGDAEWRLYAFTDRPAYRPDEQVRWKVLARRYEQGEPFTPAGQAIQYQVLSPEGTAVAEGRMTLNGFGSAWADLDLTESMRLGQYQVVFSDARGRSIGRTALFRLEEYKLPEYKVALDTRDAEGRKRSYQVGDRVSVDVVAEYYFGGPVANATVEAVVYQQPFYHWYRAPREFPWCYEAPSPPRWWGPGQIVSRQTLRTGADGRATVAFDTPEFADQDFQYRVEARVTDASRREITGSDTLRVTRQHYYAYLEPERHVYEPRETVRVDIRTLDADSQPVSVTGQLTVTRETWREIWIAPDGREVEGEQLERLRGAQPSFPPPGPPGLPGWRLKKRGYESEQIFSRAVPTDGDGRGMLTFQPPVDGYYRVEWRSPDTLDPSGALAEPDWGDWITSEAMVWVCSDRTRFIGYHQGGVDVVVDRDTIQPGRDAAVMISTPTSGRHVLFTVEGNALFDHRVVHVPGNVRLVQVPVTEAYIPNVYLGAAMVADAALLGDREEIVVPPVRQYLDVTVEPDRDAYEPRETGTLTVTTRDQEGRPVEAELALALYDASVDFIQEDMAGDPRAFFFQRRQGLHVRTGSTFDHRPYATLQERPDDDDAGAARDEQKRLSGVAGMELDALESASVAGGRAAPASAMAPAPARQLAKSSSREMLADMADDAGGAGAEPDQAVQVRSDFRSTLLWLPDLVTGPDGTASVPIDYADSLTQWKAVARAATGGYQFGIATATTRTRKPLIARLQAPRFFVVGDRVTISAVVNNNTDVAIPAMVALDADGVEVLGVQRDGRLVPGYDADVEVPAGRDARVDWTVEVRRPGPVTLSVSAQGRQHADAMRRTLVAYDHGIEQLVASALKLRDGDEAVLQLDIPSARRESSTEMTVHVAPSLAVTMLDSLPYLVDFPYGCTEQTMSRFLPAVIVARALRDLQLDPEVAMSRVFGGIEENAKGAVHPKGPKSLARLEEMVTAGLDRLADMQHGDGGWGWWKGGSSDRFMSAYVLWGLSLAKEAGVTVDDGMLARGAGYVEKQLVEEEFDYDRQAWMLHALAAHAEATGRREPGEFARRALENLLAHRNDLNAYTRALLALAAKGYGAPEQAAALARNLINGVSRDDAPDTSTILRNGRPHRDTAMTTAHWGRDGVWWRWSEGAVESTAFALRALLAIDPGHELVEPTTTWLIANRRGAQWSNTRDTAISVLALTDYLKVSGELERPVSYEITVNGQVVAERTVTPQQALAAPARFVVDRRLVVDGRNEVRVRRTDGEGPLYVSAEARYFSLQEPVPAAGNQLFVRRDYYRLVPRPTLLKGYVYDRVRLADEDYVDSGDRIEVVVTVETKNDGEYLVFEDLKPAGFEAVAVRSGEGLWARALRADAVQRVFGDDEVGARIDDGADYTGEQRWVHQELRDRAVAMFVDRMPQGLWEIRYDLRAEAPGRFHALPLLGHAMYVPEIRANGDEIRVTVRE